MYGSFVPKRTLFAKFCMILAMSKSPRRISFVGAVSTRPSASGATMAGQKNLRNTKAPTAVYFASGKRGRTEL